MSELNRPENFRGRVNYAAAVISAGRRPTRSFDNCFENWDGDAVAAALMRRAEKNQRLRENLPRYISLSMAEQNHAEYAGRDLAEVSRELRLAAAWTNFYANKCHSVGELEQLAGTQDRAGFWKRYADDAQSLDHGVADLKKTIVALRVKEGRFP
ncbi:MAG: hypothetical protein DI537_10330 [Stutzerimonas stutzeri]|nr:MAG: hypothetical protein DI537_10330 [Stutzerimonas stutzeri]